MPYRGRARGRSKDADAESQVGPPPVPSTRSTVISDEDVESVGRQVGSLALIQTPPPPAFSDHPSIASYVRGAEAASTPPPEIFSDNPSTASYVGGAGDASTIGSGDSPAEPGPAGTVKEADPDLGAIPKRRDGAPGSDKASDHASRSSSSAGQQSGGHPSGSVRSGRRSDFIQEVIFGGYSKDNKKEFRSYISTDTRQKDVTYTTGEAGEKWERADIVANSFPLAADIANIELDQYHVSFEPVQDATRKRIGLVRENIGSIMSDSSAAAKMIFDGAVLFLPASVRLRDGRNEITKEIATDSSGNLRLTMKHTACLTTSSPTVKQILNRIFRDAQGATGLVQIGRHYFNHAQPTQIQKYSIDIWPGFSTRIDQYDGGIMVTLDTISKVMKNKNVLELMQDWARPTPSDPAPNVRSKAEKEIIGETVLTRYNNKTYRIDGIEWKESPLSEFTKSDGTTLSYKAYYKAMYNLEVDDNQPLLIHRPKPKEQRMRDLQGLKGNIFLIPQLCNLTGLGTMRQDMTTMREVAKVTRFDPRERQAHMTRFIRKMQENPEAAAELDKLDLRFGRSLVQVDNARIIPLTEIRQGGQALRYRREQADWSRALADSRFNDGLTLANWYVILPKREEAPVRKFVGELIQVGRRVGMSVTQPEYLPLEQLAGREYLDKIRQLGDGSEMIMCVLPDDKKDRYDAIKQLTCCQKPIPSQLILAKTCKKENILHSVATKVLLQMNCKLRGSPWDVHLPVKKSGVLMVVGVDTFVDAKMATKSSSKVNGALVASYDPQATKWYSRPLLGTEETVVRGLEKSFEQALRNYRQHNDQLPERIVIYRDGVGDGQLANVQRDEVQAISKACERCNPGFLPKLTFCVVTKRVPQRFFLRRGPDFVNPLPGTLVDATVTKHRSEMIDFFIVSQSTNQGTVSPTHYNLIYDSSGWNLDRQQLLAYKLCHLYYNWAGAIRVPAPCQYAHKLAFMVNQNLHNSPSDVLCERLWYL